MGKILVVGALGQLGSELTERLQLEYGAQNVVAADIAEPSDTSSLFFERLDITKAEQLNKIIEKYDISQVYQLAAILSAKGEQDPQFAWHLNMTGLLNTLEAAKTYSLEKIYWPSSIAVFGPDTPKVNTPQNTVMNPNTVYGISKLAGERWCEYYFEKYGVDVRSLRYPGLIGYKAMPGGGTTDYAVDIFHKAIAHERYTCFLQKNTALPMMYMDDAVKATIDLMKAPKDLIKVRSSYNLAAISFTPEELFLAIRKELPSFEIKYAPDFRQAIADSWPDSIDDSNARKDWGWKPSFDINDYDARDIRKAPRI